MSKAGVIQGEYLYNEEGQQVVRETPSTGAVIHVIHDLSGNRIAEYDGSTGARLTEYVWLGLESAAAVLGGNLCLLRADYIGWPVLVTDVLGGGRLAVLKVSQIRFDLLPRSQYDLGMPGAPKG